MNQVVSPPLSKARLEMIDACGRLSQLLRLPRSTGQIYGLLFFSTRPMCLDEIAETLRISKASCSTGTRELCSWNALRVVWVHGDRKDHFEVEPELATMLRTAYSEFIAPRLVSSSRRFDRLMAALNDDLQNGALTPEEHKILAQRLKGFSDFQQRALTLMPLAETLL
jgi:DNA-binding transcriptional regulator GbsR (MarR family)